MSSRVLDFRQNLGGADNVILLNLFPRSQKTFNYNFGVDITNYTFSADYHSIVIDQLAYERNTGNPNFANSRVIGYQDNETQIDANVYISVKDTLSGSVNFTIPHQRYTGALLPSARELVVITVVSFEWTTSETPPQKDGHRYAVIETWEPGVPPGDPTQETGFVSLVEEV
jgi:hypothetical protein